MKVRNAALCYFSPTRSTFKIMMYLSSGMNLGINSTSLNITSAAAREKQHVFDEETLFVAGAPVYGGRLPAVAPSLFENVRGNDTPAVLFVAYGGRAYDDALLELYDRLKSRGFIPLAAAAFIAQHASLPEISPGRPDNLDIEKIKSFGALVREKLSNLSGNTPELKLPGSRPYAAKPQSLGISPITNDKCIYCMQCYRWCPTDAIAYYSPNETNASKCILCQGCVRRCPLSARVVLDEGFKIKMKAMGDALKGIRKEPEFFT